MGFPTGKHFSAISYQLQIVEQKKKKKKPCHFPSLCLDSKHFHTAFPTLVAAIYKSDSHISIF